jgi:chitin deacetylase
MRFAVSPGWVTGRDFGDYLCDSFDVLHEEGGRMMSVGLHCRLVGRPAKAAGLSSSSARRAEGRRLVRHPRADRRPLGRPPPARGPRAPVRDAPQGLRQRFGGIVEHSPGSPTAPGTWSSARPRQPSGLANAWPASCARPRGGAARRPARPPDLAGKLAAAKRLTADSTAEQASAGLDALTDEERERFQALNAA